MLQIEPTADGDIAWTLDGADTVSEPPRAPPGLSPTGEIEFLMPGGYTYVWKWRHIRDLLLGAVVVMCSAERRVFNLHCRGVDPEADRIEFVAAAGIEFDCYAIESGGTIDCIVVFAPF